MEQAPEPSLLPPGVRLWWAGLKPAVRWAWVGGCVALVVGGMLLARPAYRWAREVRAGHLVGSLREVRDEASLLRAVQDAHAAYQLAPHHPPVIRAMAELYATINTERSVAFWQALIGHTGATEDDRRAYVRAMLAFHRPEAAAPVLGELRQRYPYDVELIRLQAQYHLERGEQEAVEAVLRQGLERHPRNAALLLVLAAQRVSQGREGQQEARELLIRAMEDDGPEGLAALELLVRRMELSPEEAEKVAHRVESHPQAGDQRRFWLSELELRQRPQHRERVINEVVARYRQAEPAQMAQAGRWLNQQGASAAVPDVIPVSLALTRQDLFLIWADSMALQKRWQELGKVLADAQVPLDRELVWLFRARVARELGNKTEEQAAWRRAMSEAASRPEMLWYMARYAERLGEVQQALAVYETLCRMEAEPRQAWLSRIRLLEQAGDTPALLRTLEAMAERYPQEAAIRNDLVYLRLLLRKDEEAAAADALARVAAEPRMMSYRVTAALALLRLGRAEEARKMLEDVGIQDWKRLHAGWQAVRVAVLGACGDRKGARAAAGDIPVSRLKPEELALIQVWH